MTNWIEVSTATPPSLESVLICLRGTVGNAYWDGKEKTWFQDGWFHQKMSLSGVTHWARLPEPPK